MLSTIIFSFLLIIVPELSIDSSVFFKAFFSSWLKRIKETSGLHPQTKVIYQLLIR